jgi:hypothetical protein
VTDWFGPGLLHACEQHRAGELLYSWYWLLCIGGCGTLLPINLVICCSAA